MQSDDDRAAVIGFIRAFERGDLAALGALLAGDFVAHVTMPDGGARDVDRAGYLAAVSAMDVPSAGVRLDVPSIVAVGPGHVLAMVEALPAESAEFWS